MNRLFWPITPDMPSSVQRDADGGGTMGGGTRCRRFERAQARAPHAGMTVMERVAAGCGSPEDKAFVEAENRLHREWRDSPAGKAWLEAQPWWNAPVKVKLLGWQPGLNGTGLMLYNRFDNGSTVTLESLRKEGVVYEIVK